MAIAELHIHREWRGCRIARSREDFLQLISQSEIAFSDAHRNCKGKGQTRWVDFRFNRSNSKIVTNFSGEVPRKRSPDNREVNFLISNGPNNRFCTVTGRVEAHNRALQAPPRERLSGRRVFFVQDLYSYFQTMQCGRIE